MLLNWTKKRRSSHITMASAVALLALLSLGNVFADDQEDAAEHLAAAEEALQSNDYWRASGEFRAAAELSDDPSIAKQATRIAFTYGFNDDARTAAERWVDLDAESDEALLYQALLQLRAGEIRKSRKSFRKLLERSDEPQDERLIGLVSFLADEDPEDADLLMRQLSKAYPDSAYANYASAVLSFYAGDNDAALARAKTATELDPDWLKPQLLYARILLRSGDEEGAIDYVARLVGDDPDPPPEARLELAIMYVSAGRDDDALSQVNQVLLEQPSRTDALRLLAIINFRLKNLDAAWQDFEDLLASGHYTMDAFYYLGRIAEYREEEERAITLYSRVTQGDDAVIAQRRVAAILSSQGENDEALEHLENFGRKYPMYAVDMLQSQAQLMISLERYDEALEVFERVVNYRPDSENILLSKAELLMNMGREEDAIETFREAVKLWPDNAITLNALGYTLADRTENYKEAAKLINRALKLNPDNPAIIDSYGWVLYRQGEYEQALTELERAYEKFQDPEVAAHIVEVLFQMERFDEASERLLEAEARWPESSLLLDVREQFVPASDAD